MTAWRESLTEKTKKLVEQLGLATFGVLALLFGFHEDPDVRKWEPVIALLGQPFWFYMSVRGRMWGVFFVAVLYSLAHSYGFYKLWL
jgi:hypothetical protein